MIKRYDFRLPKIRIELTTIKGDKYELLSEQLEGDLMSLTTQKMLSNVAGTWKIELVARDNYYYVFNSINTKFKRNVRVSAYEIFQPATLIDIYINNKEVMIGIVDQCRRSSSVDSSGKPRRIITIVGRDLGAYFIDTQIWYDKNPSNIQRANNIITQQYNIVAPSIKKRNIQDILEQVYETWFSNILNQTVVDPDTNRTVGKFQYADNDLVSGKVTCSKNAGNGLSIISYANNYPTSFDTWNYKGNVFQFMKSFTAPPFHELFTDTGDRDIALHSNYTSKKPLINNYKPLNKKQLHVIFRPSPFDDKNVGTKGFQSLLDIDDLPTHYINDNLIINKDLFISKNNSPSMFIVAPMTGLVDSNRAAYYVPPTYNSRNLKRYGHNPMEIKFESFDTSSNLPATTYENMCKNYQSKLKHWFSNNDKYLVGNFTIRGDENIRIGNKLDYSVTEEGKIDEPFEKGYYYIETVSHNYQWGKMFTTSINVSRGTSYKNIPEFKKTFEVFPSTKIAGSSL